MKLTKTRNIKKKIEEQTFKLKIQSEKLKNYKINTLI